MARSLRVTYAGAWYHVANRGAGRQRVFRNDDHRNLLLELLHELRSNFNVETHAYCLMSNRYDLIVRTPSANLSKAMRHLNGVYTQSYNRMVGRDGALFRGRYRAILLEAETCLAAVSRHIHRRPLVTGNVPRLDRYRWSSYPTYVTRRKNPTWLHTEPILEQAGSVREYRQYVEREGETNSLVRQFYREARPGAILGSDAFKRRIMKRYGSGDAEVPKNQTLPNQIPVDQILKAVGQEYQVSRKHLLTSKRGRLNLPRLAAIWLCRMRGHLTLAQLAVQFGMAGYGSASAILHRIKTQMRPAFWRRVKAIEDQLSSGD